MSSGRSAPEPQKIWRMYSESGSESGSCAAMRRTRGLTVNVTSISLSRSGSTSATQKAQKYLCLLSVFSAAPASITPPQPGHSTFHDMSNSPSRAAWISAPIVASSSRPRSAAKTSGLIRLSARSGSDAAAASSAFATDGSAAWLSRSQSADDSDIGLTPLVASRIFRARRRPAPERTGATRKAANGGKPPSAVRALAGALICVNRKP